MAENGSRMLKLYRALKPADDVHGERGDDIDDDSVHTEASSVVGESTPAIPGLPLELHDANKNNECDDLPATHDSVKARYWDSEFTSGSKASRKKHRSLEEPLPLKGTNTKSKNSVDTQSQFSSVM